VSKHTHTHMHTQTHARTHAHTQHQAHNPFPLSLQPTHTITPTLPSIPAPQLPIPPPPGPFHLTAAGDGAAVVKHLVKGHRQRGVISQDNLISVKSDLISVKRDLISVKDSTGALVLPSQLSLQPGAHRSPPDQRAPLQEKKREHVGRSAWRMGICFQGTGGSCCPGRYS
jgi:hypothetical protein